MKVTLFLTLISLNFLLVEYTGADEILYRSAEPQFGDLDEITKRRLLRVLVTHSRTDFFVDQGQIRGAQADIARELMKHLNRGRTTRFHASETNRINLQFIPVPFDQLIPSLIAGKGDVAAAYLTRTPAREEQVDFVSAGRIRIKEVLVSHRAAPVVTSLKGLSGQEIHVLRGSSYVEHLVQLNEKFHLVDLPEVRIIEADERLLTEDILELVNAGIVSYTFSDDFKADLWKEVLPSIHVHNDVYIAENQTVGWAIRKNSPQLKGALFEVAEKVKKGSLLGNILFKRYFENTNWINNPNSLEERKKFNQIVSLFQHYGNQFGFDPLALAAQAYQESKLNNDRESPRGAIGIMQLLPSTARDPNVDIPDIKPLENNIHAGTKYMWYLRDRYFSDDEMDGLNQRLFTWAAYNAGPANVAKIRKAAHTEGLDRNIWFDNVEHMAAKMISREPVRYVANIYKYYIAYKLIDSRDTQRQNALQDVLR